MGRKFASDLRAKRRKFSQKAEDLQVGAARLKAAYKRDPKLLPSGFAENAVRRSEEFKEKAAALNSAIRLEELSVFTYTKKKADKSYRYWKAEWRAQNGRMNQAHLGPAEGKRALSEEEALLKARKMKAEDLEGWGAKNMMTKEQDRNLLKVAEEFFDYSPCLHCKHYFDDDDEDSERFNEPSACDAFPEGIPEEIFFGRNLHKEPYPGDHGITFEQAD